MCNGIFLIDIMKSEDCSHPSDHTLTLYTLYLMETLVTATAFETTGFCFVKYERPKTALSQTLAALSRQWKWKSVCASPSVPAVCLCVIFKSHIYGLIYFYFFWEDINRVQLALCLPTAALQCSTAEIYLAYVSSAGNKHSVEVNSLKCVTVIMSYAYSA